MCASPRTYRGALAHAPAFAAIILNVRPAIAPAESAPLGATMLLVLSLFGYPIDGLTQSTVLGLNEVLKANRYVAEGYLTVGAVVILLVWICAAARHLYERRSVLHD